MVRAGALALVLHAGEREHARPELQVRAHRFGGHPWRARRQREHAQVSGDRLSGQRRRGGMVVHLVERLAEVRVFHLAAVRRAGAVDDALHLLRKALARARRVVRPHGARKAQRVRDDVALLARLHEAQRVGEHLLRRHGAHAQRQQLLVNRAEAVNRADRQIGPRAVAAPPVDRHVKAERARHRRAVQHRDLPRRDVPAHMRRIARVHGKVRVDIRQQVLKEALAALLLAALEDEQHAAGHLLRMRGQRARRAQKHRHVRVVAAGVHHARILRDAAARVLQVRRALLHGQRVAVRAQQHAGALLALPQHADHATVRDDVDAQLQRLQRGDDVSKRLRLLSGELRVLVQPPPVRNHLLLVRAEHVNRRHKCLLGETSGLPP